jgi:hypothetical protein
MAAPASAPPRMPSAIAAPSRVSHKPLQAFNGAGILRNATGLLLSLCATSSLRRAGTGLFVCAAVCCVLCSGAVLWAGLLLQRLLRSAPFRA